MFYRMFHRELAKDFKKHGRFGLEVMVGTAKTHLAYVASQEPNSPGLKIRKEQVMSDIEFAKLSGADNYGAMVFYRALSIMGSSLPPIRVREPGAVPSLPSIARAKKLLQEFVHNHQGRAFIPVARQELKRLEKLEKLIKSGKKGVGNPVPAGNVKPPPKTGDNDVQW